MKLKLDENLGRDVAEALRAAGHDVETVVDEQLSGAPDRSVIEAARVEERALVTLDLDFGNPLLFRHSAYHGVALFRIAGRVTATALAETAQVLVRTLSSKSIAGKLWIVQGGRVREYQPPDAP